MNQQMKTINQLEQQAVQLKSEHEVVVNDLKSKLESFVSVKKVAIMALTASVFVIGMFGLLGYIVHLNFE